MPQIESAELVSVGTELLLGEIVDTNSAYLASDLAARGVDVLWSARVGDNRARIEALIEQALARSDLVVLGGGLGPTDDDVTRDAVAAVVGEEQYADDAIVEWLRRRFSATGIAMPERNLQQANAIASATMLANPIGTAPGWLVRTSRGGRERVIVTLPGPPRELKRMWREQAVPRLAFPSSRLFIRTFKTFGVGESRIAERLGELTTRANPSVATYAKRDGVHVRVAAKAGDERAARELAEPTLAAVERALDGAVWGLDDEDLPLKVLEALAGSGRRLALAEGMSGGLITELLEEAQDDLTPDVAATGGTGGQTAGRSELVRMALAGSVIAWQPDSMRSLRPALELLMRLPTDLPAGAAQVVAAVAAAVREIFAADVGLAVGYPIEASVGATSAPPRAGAQDGEARTTEDVTAREARSGPALPSTTHLVIAISATDGTTTKTLELPTLGRAWLRERSAFASLNLLLESALR
ncbi:MAG TPA: molybdopterin-binding protein [Trueperaceae bacterium]|nr:molybdopterin-binding protein [Trueperaceae bacterium]